MKKLFPKIVVGFVFLIFGFMLATQLNISNSVSSVDGEQNAEILMENEELKKKKEELQSVNEELNTKIKNYEAAAADQNQSNSLLVEELQKTRLSAGLVDVKGPGIVIYITPKATLLGPAGTVEPYGDAALLNIVNELNAQGAEAISINGYRLTSGSGIRASGSNIVVNNYRISPKERVTIHAIGDKTVLEKCANFAGVIPDSVQRYADVKIESSDNITIKKGEETRTFQYAKPDEK